MGIINIKPLQTTQKRGSSV